MSHILFDVKAHSVSCSPQGAFPSGLAEPCCGFARGAHSLSAWSVMTEFHTQNVSVSKTPERITGTCQRWAACTGPCNGVSSTKVCVCSACCVKAVHLTLVPVTFQGGPAMILTSQTRTAQSASVALLRSQLASGKTMFKTTF